MNVVIFWDVAQCGKHMHQLFRGTYHLHLQHKKSAKQETACSALISTDFPP
jgi:hypothetical protein